jgi:hypothetical protein
VFRATVSLVSTVRTTSHGAMTLHADEVHTVGVLMEPSRQATTVFVTAANEGVRRHMLEVRQGDVVHVTGRLVGLRPTERDSKAQMVGILAEFVLCVAKSIKAAPAPAAKLPYGEKAP